MHKISNKKGLLEKFLKVSRIVHSSFPTGKVWRYVPFARFSSYHSISDELAALRFMCWPNHLYSKEMVTKKYYYKVCEGENVVCVWLEDKGTNYGLDVYPKKKKKKGDKRLSFKRITIIYDSRNLGDNIKFVINIIWKKKKIVHHCTPKRKPIYTSIIRRSIFNTRKLRAYKLRIFDKLKKAYSQ